MATEQIKVDTGKLKNYSNEVKNCYKNIYAYLSQSKVAVKNLKSSWTGTAANEFYARFDTILAKSEQVLDVVNQYSLILSESADVYNTNESKVANNASKLKIQLK